MSETVTLTLTKREANALATAAEAGLRSGQMLTLLSDPEDDMALVEGLVKLKKSMEENKHG